MDKEIVNRSVVTFTTRIKELEAIVTSLSAEIEILQKENVRLAKSLSDGTKDQTDGESHTGPSMRAEENPQSASQERNLAVINWEGVDACTTSTCDKVQPKAGKRKKRNAAKGDISHYSKRHVALKLMYLGSRYHGFASQAGSQRTVEAELFAALEKTRLIIGKPSDAQYSRCGRTDKGVSAIGQVVALYLRSNRKLQEEGHCTVPKNVEDTSDLAVSLEPSVPEEIQQQVKGGDREELIQTENTANEVQGDRVMMARASRSEEEVVAATADEEEIDYVGVLNRALPDDIRMLGWCPVPHGFNARFSCLYREYKYFFIDDGLNINEMKVACKKFEGEHDFSNFCKMDAANVHNYVRTINNFTIVPVDERWGGRQVWVMRVKGTAFLWHQVRCMAAVLFMVGYGHESPMVVEELLDLSKFVRKPQYIMAPELPLLLSSCGFQGLVFQCLHDGLRHLRLHLEKQLQDILVNAALLQQGLLELTISGNTLRMCPNHESKKSIHVPLTIRPTEPSYKERRGRTTSLTAGA